MRPSLARRDRCGVTVWWDEALAREHGVLVVFTERVGGASVPPYESLNLAGHVGDVPATVDENRRRLLEAAGLGAVRARLTCAEQVHGCEVAAVSGGDAGSGAFAGPADARPPVAGVDALVTTSPGIPLALFFADCVPIILVAPRARRRGVAVVHAGWRGALGRLPGKVARTLAREVSCPASELVAYIGPHICPRHYEVGWDTLSQFESAFDTIAAAPEAWGRRGPLDLGAAVSESLSEVGLPPRNVLHAGLCTYESQDAFYSYRRAAITGRHAAVACVTEEGS